METENNTVFENDISLPQSLEVEEIIEFYKDLDTSNEPEDIEVVENKPKIKQLFSLLKKNKNNDTEIQSEVYGLSENTRLIIYRSLSAVISVCIIAGAFLLAYFLPGNEDVIKEQQETLRSEKSYESLKSRHDTLKTEIDNLKKSNSEKKKQIDKIADFDNTKAELKTQISAKAYELNALNSQIEDKRKTLAELEASIKEKTPPETVLPPGKYVVGKNIAAGKYLITGTGKFMVATAAGKSKINTTIGSTPIEISLDKNDVVKFDSKVKFTSLN